MIKILWNFGLKLRPVWPRLLSPRPGSRFSAQCPHALGQTASVIRSRAVTDRQPFGLSVDGIGAYDDVLRAAMLGRLGRLLRAKAILPFVRFSYAQPSTHSWFNE